MNAYSQNDYRDYLQHHGILGMRWGVRRYQNKDGSFTPAGKKRYSGNGNSKKKNTNDFRKKSLKQAYDGLSDEQKRKIKKAAIAVGALALTAAVGYAVYRGWSDEHVDKIIKAGTNVHTIGKNPNKSFDKPFYAAYKAGDRLRYRGMLGFNMLMQNDSPVAYAYKHQLANNLKIPSHEKATELFSGLLNRDKEFRDQFEHMTDKWLFTPGNWKQKKLISDVVDGLGKGRTDKKFMRKAYDAYNLMLVDHDSGGTFDKSHSRFYSELKRFGYGAVMDMNDMLYSGYRSKAPIIIFDAQSKTDAAIEELGLGKVLMNFVGADAINTFDAYKPLMGISVAAGAGKVAYSNTKQNKKGKRR